MFQEMKLALQRQVRSAADFFKPITRRVKARTPAFWVRIRIIGMQLSAAASAVFGAAYAGYLPAWMLDLASHVLAASVVISALSQMTVVDAEYNNEVKKNKS